MSKPRIAVEFDGVLHLGQMRPDSRTIEMKARQGARAFLARVALEFDVYVISPRFADPVAMKVAMDWGRVHFGDIVDELHWHPGFPNVGAIISARAIRFRLAFPQPDEIFSRLR